MANLKNQINTQIKTNVNLYSRRNWFYFFINSKFKQTFFFRKKHFFYKNLNWKDNKQRYNKGILNINLFLNFSSFFFKSYFFIIGLPKIKYQNWLMYKKSMLLIRPYLKVEKHPDIFNFNVFKNIKIITKLKKLFIKKYFYFSFFNTSFFELNYIWNLHLLKYVPSTSNDFNRNPFLFLKNSQTSFNSEQTLIFLIYSFYKIFVIKQTSLYSNKPLSLYSNKPLSLYSNKPLSLYSNKPLSLYSNKPLSLYSNKPLSLYSNKPLSLYSNKPLSLYSNKPLSLYSNKPLSLYSNKPLSLYSNKPLSLYSNKPLSLYSNKPLSLYSNNLTKIPTTSNLTLIFNSSGLFFRNQFIFKKNLTNQHLANIKKKLFSFGIQNDYHKFILRRYIKTFTLNNFTLNNFTLNQYFNNKYWFHLISLQSFFNLINKSQLFLETFNYGHFLTTQNPNIFYLSTPIINEDNNSLTEQDQPDPNELLNIKRIRFKPGYQRIWRLARMELKNMLLLKFKYQKKLTHYLQRFKRYFTISFFKNIDLTLHTILMRAKFFNNNEIIDLFINSGLIFVNGYIAWNKSLILYKFDFIQLIISYKYYILYRWFLNWTLKFKKKFKKILLRKLRTFDLEDRKQRTYLFPDLIKKIQHYWLDAPQFCEIDFLSLSIFIIYEPFSIYNTSPYYVEGRRDGVIYMYNWKYIT